MFEEKRRDKFKKEKVMDEYSQKFSTQTSKK